MTPATLPALAVDLSDAYHGWLVNKVPTATFLAVAEAHIAEQRELLESVDELQRAEENILLLHAERIAADLAEALCEYVADRPRGATESAAGAERRATLAEALRLMSAAVR
jgi:hypothetical protein